MKWTEMEENILRKYYPIEGSEVANRLPNRTQKSCIQHAYYINLSVTA